MTVVSRGLPGRGSGIGFAPFFYASSENSNRAVDLWAGSVSVHTSIAAVRPWGVVNVRVIVHTPRHQGTRAPGSSGIRPLSPPSRPLNPAGMRHNAAVLPRSPFPVASCGLEGDRRSSRHRIPRFPRVTPSHHFPRVSLLAPPLGFAGRVPRSELLSARWSSLSFLLTVRCRPPLLCCPGPGTSSPARLIRRHVRSFSVASGSFCPVAPGSGRPGLRPLPRRQRPCLHPSYSSRTVALAVRRLVDRPSGPQPSPCPCLSLTSWL